MAFLDNSGDIILDAVLTDLGRQRLAKGDGSFSIKKFSLGDEEINYALYNRNHLSGNAYYDLEILQTPVLEAFTNNASTMKTRLLTIQDPGHLYLPIIKQFDKLGTGAERHVDGYYGVAVDESTVDAFSTLPSGILNGFNPGDPNSARVEVHQGLDTVETGGPLGPALVPELVETQYIVEIDGRLGSLTSALAGPNVAATETFIDDDGIYTYVFTLSNHASFVDSIPPGSATQVESSINGPRGTSLKFRINSSQGLQYDSYLFSTLNGGLTTVVKNNHLAGSNVTCLYVDTTVRVTGIKTGYSIDLPIRFLKKA